MKKILALTLCMCMVMLLTACGKDAAKHTANKEQPKATELVLATKNSVENYADFTLFKISTAKKITASVADNFFYENNNSGETFVDIILDWTNNSSETISSSDIVVASATNSSGTTFTNCLYAVETDNATSLSQFENIAPLSTVRLHCAVSVPETETALTLNLVVKGKKFTYNYTLGQNANTAKEIKVGDTIEEVDFATLVFKGIEYTDDLLPSNTSKSYSHYEVKNNDNTYLVAKFDITNNMSSEKECGSFVGVKAMYMDKYTYTGFAVAEDNDGRGFSNYERIAPLSIRHVFYLMEVPKTVVENDVVITISFNGKEYSFTGKK